MDLKIILSLWLENLRLISLKIQLKQKYYRHFIFKIKNFIYQIEFLFFKQ